MNQNTDQPGQNICLSKGIQLLQRFAQFDQKMQLSTAMTLLYVARYQDSGDGISTRDLADWAGMSPASASRNTYYWDAGTRDMPNSGYGLVSVTPDPVDRRRRVLRLTPRGQAFVNQLVEVLNGTAER